jgi:hypothetical protein
MRKLLTHIVGMRRYETDADDVAFTTIVELISFGFCVNNLPGW